MDHKYFFKDETLITESDNKAITLTTHRIRHKVSYFGRVHIVSILLHKVSAIAIHYKSNALYAILGGALLFIGTLGLIDGRNVAIPALGTGAVFLAIYLLTRNHVVSISAVDGTKITFRTNGMPTEVLLDFVNKIETAVQERTKVEVLLSNIKHAE